MQYQHKILSSLNILLHVGNRARSYGKNLNLHSKSAFFKIVVTGFLLIKQPLFLDLDERHQLVCSSWTLLTNVQGFALSLPLGLPLFFVRSRCLHPHVFLMASRSSALDVYAHCCTLRTCLSKRLIKALISHELSLQELRSFFTTLLFIDFIANHFSTVDVFNRVQIKTLDLGLAPSSQIFWESTRSQ